MRRDPVPGAKGDASATYAVTVGKPVDFLLSNIPALDKIYRVAPYASFRVRLNMKHAAVVFGLLSALTAQAQAGAFSWATSQDQMSVAMKIGSAMANANLCNFEVDTDGMATVIRDRIAGTGKLTPEMASGLVFSVVGTGSVQAQTLGLANMNKRQLAKHCADIISAFGPNGSSLAGLLKP